MTHRWARGFSTLGCLELSVADTAARAREYGIAGVELRVGVVELPTATEVGSAFSQQDVEVFAVASSARLADPDTPLATRERLRSDIATANALGASFVRVFPGGSSRQAAAAHLTALADILGAPGAPVLAVETHDALPTGREVAALVADLGHPRLGAVWDALHPWRHGEAPAATAEALLGLPGYVQVKDARSLDDLTPCLLGTGVVPLDDVRRALVAHDYTGWVSIEWERAWYPQVPPLAEVLDSPGGW